MATPTIGDTVEYRLDPGDAAVIRERRKQAPTVRHGGPVHAGDVVPLVVTAVADTRVNGQALLDGDDSLWVAEADHGSDAGQWRPR